VLQYARALGLDPDEIATELKTLTQFDEDPPLPSAEAAPAGHVRGKSGFGIFDFLEGMGGSTLGSLLAAVGVIMACALVYSWLQSPPRVRDVPAAPSTPQEVAKAPEAAPTPAPPPESADAKPAAPVRVGLSADEMTWISVSSDGKNVFANLLQPHDTKVVEASEKVRILIGNAGGLEISLNGKPIGPVGPRGQIRVVELTSAGFQIVPRKSPTLEPL
jgi:hypothetical protein